MLEIFLEIAKYVHGFSYIIGDVTLPQSKRMPDSDRKLNYVFIADEAFPLKDHIMRPYPGRDLNTDSKKIYNYRLSRARRVVENAFGRFAVMRLVAVFLL